MSIPLHPVFLRILTAAWLPACCLAACSRVADAPPPSATVPAPVVTTLGRTAAPSGGGLPARLCAVLRSKTPELTGMSEVGARAQLVMAIGTAFDADAAALGIVSSDIDAIASAGCAEVREPLLAATRAQTLQEAVR